MGSLKPFPLDLAKARKEICKGWRLKGDMGLSNLGDWKALLQFATKGEELRVLQKGSRSCKIFGIELCRWKPNNGCQLNHEELKDLWVRLVGLPIHLWELKILKKIQRCLRGLSCSRQEHYGFLVSSVGSYSCSSGRRKITKGAGDKFGKEEGRNSALVGSSSCEIVGDGGAVLQSW